MMLSRRSLLLATASILVALNDDDGLALAFAPTAPPSANNANGVRAHASASSMTTMMAASPPDANNDNNHDDDDDDNNHGLASRRNFLADLLHPRMAAGSALLAAVLAYASADAADALDFDAFEKGEIASDTAKCDPKRDPKCIPKLSSDEALCQYGGGGNARGEACMRVRAGGGKLPTVKKEKSLGGAYAM